MTSSSKDRIKLSSNDEKHLVEIADEIMRHAGSKDLFEWRPRASDAISRIFRNAFYFGGLREIDRLIEDVNAVLERRGSRYTLTPGAACMMDLKGEPDALMVYYRPSGKTEPVCNQWISLEKN